MKLVDLAIRNAVSVAVAALLLILFGVLSLARLPVQLTPDVDRPVVTVTTFWPGASPQEVEREITDPQEEHLKSVEGLVRLTSESNDSLAEVQLEFKVGVNLDTALLHTANTLDRVPSYPENVEKPFLSGTGGDDSNAIAWFILQPAEGNDVDISTLFDFAEDEIKARFERVPGVARSNVYGGRERELRVIVDPERLAAHGVSFRKMAEAIDAENINRSAGSLDEGKRRYVFRTVGEFRSIEDVENTVVAVRDGAHVYVKDLAEVRLDYKKPGASVWHKGERSLAINALRETGANVLETMAGLKQAMEELNRGLLRDEGLYLQQPYDETLYIDSSIGLVKQNLVVGGTLAVMVLLVFLHSVRATIVVALAIPLSVIGTFIAMNAFGRSLNVISLAGLAFAVGMVVDNAIVVLENIHRHTEMGKPVPRAASEGTSEVWGAVLASTLTTAAVFLPVLFIEEEAGQLFRDIALAISAAVLLSLVVSLTVIPTLAVRLIRPKGKYFSGKSNRWLELRERLLPAGVAVRGMVVKGVDRVLSTRRLRIATLVAMTGLSLGLSWLLAPKVEYLPTGNRNLVFGMLLPPPGYNLSEVERMGQDLAESLRPYFEAETRREAGLDAPPIENLFFVSWGRFAFLGAISAEPRNARELIPVIRRPLMKVPGLIPVVSQSSLFSSHGSQGNNIDIEITGPDIENLLQLGMEVFGRVQQVIPGAQARPIPSLDLGNPEVRITPDRARASELGLSTHEIGFAVDAMVDGVKVSEYRLHGDAIDLTLTGRAREEGGIKHGHELSDLRLYTPAGKTVTLGTVASVEMESGPEQINHIERERAITIQLQPPESVPLGEAIEIIESQIVAPIQEAGRLSPHERIHLSGAADALSQALRSFRWNFLLALVITYLLMSALFENFLYPLVIMFSVPLAALGGFAGLRLVHVFVPTQGLDLLTMLGFVILIGTVVNNAILVVHQTLIGMRERGLDTHNALLDAVRVRVRPIFMSMATSVFGMLPLVLSPGAGSEIYRGLGSVVVGGLLVSTVFTLFLIPALFSLVLEAYEAAPGILQRIRQKRFFAP